MSYRTKRPRMRSILTFGVGATLAITQLGAGCVPNEPATPCSADASDEACSNNNTVPDAGSSTTDGGAKGDQ